MKLTHAPLFAGINGFGLAADWLGMEQVFHCEIDEFCQRVIQYYWPQSTPYYDIKKTDFKKHRGTVGILSGGFPCQPFSQAGKRKGTDDNRYLWPEYLRAIREIQPLAVVGENVTGIFTMEEREVFARLDSRRRVRFDDYDQYEAVYTRQAKMLVSSIIEDLEKEGYKVQTFNIPASGVGAPHKRERVWFVAYRNNGQRKQQKRKVQAGWYTSPGSSESNASNADSFERRERGVYTERPKEAERYTRSCSTREAGGTWEDFPTQPPVCGGNDGIPSELDDITVPKWRNESIKGFGNAVVPHVPYQIMGAIQEYFSSIYY